MFDLLRIDLSEGFGDQSTPATVEFTGTKSGGSTVSTSFTVDGTFGFEAFSFAGQDFTDLEKVEWRNFSPFHQFDNIEAIPAIVSTAAVPEPSSLALFAIGAIGLVGNRARRRI